MVEVKFDGESTNERYANKHSEMWHTIAKRLLTGAIPNYAELRLISAPRRI